MERGRTWEHNGVYYTIRWREDLPDVSLSMGPEVFTLYSNPRRVVVSSQRMIGRWYLPGGEKEYEYCVANPDAMFAEMVLSCG